MESICVDSSLVFQEVRKHVREARMAAKPRAAADARPHSTLNKAHPAHSHEPKSKQLTSWRLSEFYGLGPVHMQQHF